MSALAVNDRGGVTPPRVSEPRDLSSSRRFDARPDRGRWLAAALIAINRKDMDFARRPA
jgi:hypothetical protein